MAQNIYSKTDEYAIVITDNGKGGLVHNGQLLSSSSINYGTGEIRLAQNALRKQVSEPVYTLTQIAPTASQQKTIGSFQSRESYITAANANVVSINAADTRNVSQTISTGLLTYDLLQNQAKPCAVLLNSWVFEIDGKRTIERDGVLYQDWDAISGKGKVVGSLTVSGSLKLNNVSANGNPVVKVLQGVYINGSYEVQEFHGRTATAPVKPQSFTAYAENSGTTLVGKAQADETLLGSLQGKIESETGYFNIRADKPIAPDSLRYNAVSQSTVPLDSSIIGINATRLPLDGKVPIYRTGDLIVLHNTHHQDIGSAHTAGQTIQLARQNLDRLCVKDSKGVHVAAEKYDYDLEVGSLTWRTPLDLQDYAMPLSVAQIWEEENRLVEVDISGVLKLQNPVSRDFPKENTYVSSAIVAGDLLVRATEPFSQKAWTNVWQNTRIGDPLLAKTNVKDYPIEVTADGTISERWLLKFTSTTQFELYGESLGLVTKSDTLSDLAPINPATNKPYFRLPAAAFGGGWETQNCIRFNTSGTPVPLWIVRAISPSAQRSNQRDGWSICLRGDTIEL